MRHPRTKADFARWLKKEWAELETVCRYADYYDEIDAAVTVEEARRYAARFGVDPGEEVTTITPRKALAILGKLLEQLASKPTNALLTVTEVAGRLQVNRDKVLGWIAYGRLRAVNTAKSALGRPRWRVKPADLEDFLAGRSGVA